jgi:alkylated DNA repair dioxygenase AlkB
MQAQAALQGIGEHTRKGGQHGAAEKYAGGCDDEQFGTGGSRKQAVPQPAETGAERKRRDRHLLRDHRGNSRAQGHQTRRRLLDDQSTEAGGKKAGCDLGSRGARSEISLDRGGKPAAKIRVATGRGDEECGRSLVGEYRFGDCVAIRRSIRASTRYFEELGCYEPLDLARDLGLEEKPAAVEPSSRSLHAAPLRRPRHKLDGERRPGEKQIGRGPQQIPAERSPMQRNGPGQSEMPIDKRVEACAPAVDVPMDGIADDGAGELLLGYLRHLFTSSTAAHIVQTCMCSRQLSFFEPLPSLPEGLAYQAELLSPEEEAELLEQFRELDFREYEFHGYLGKRRVVSFGLHYEADESMVRNPRDIPAFLQTLRQRSADFARLAPAELQQALVTEYTPGAGIGWHRDRPAYRDVIGVSFGSPCRFRLRRKRGSSWERASLILEPRSIYLLRGPARSEWQHSIPLAESLRYSVTFRSMRDGQ